MHIWKACHVTGGRAKRGEGGLRIGVCSTSRISRCFAIAHLSVAPLKRSTSLGQEGNVLHGGGVAAARGLERARSACLHITGQGKAEQCRAGQGRAGQGSSRGRVVCKAGAGHGSDAGDAEHHSSPRSELR